MSKISLMNKCSRVLVTKLMEQPVLLLLLLLWD
jgi:hypothetical protein